MLDPAVVVPRPATGVVKVVGADALQLVGHRGDVVAIHVVDDDDTSALRQVAANDVEVMLSWVVQRHREPTDEAHKGSASAARQEFTFDVVGLVKDLERRRIAAGLLERSA